MSEKGGWIGFRKSRERSSMKTLRVWIASYEEMKARMIAIARGQYKPRAGEPRGLAED